MKLLIDEPIPVEALCGDAGANDPSLLTLFISSITLSLIKNSNNRIETKATTNLLKWFLLIAIRKFITTKTESDNWSKQNRHEWIWIDTPSQIWSYY